MNTEIGERRTNAPSRRAGSDQPDADAEDDNDQTALGVVAVLDCVIPMIEHLHDRGTDADGQKNGNEEPSNAPPHERDDSMGKRETTTGSGGTISCFRAARVVSRASRFGGHGDLAKCYDLCHSANGVSNASSMC
jgi:hypothetical protein